MNPNRFNRGTVRKELIDAAQPLENTSLSTLQDIKTALSSFTVDSTNVHKAAYILTKLVSTEREKHTFRNIVTPKSWNDKKASTTRDQIQQMERFEKRALYNRIVECVIGLYETNTKIRHTLDYFLGVDESLPYFDLILINASKDIDGVDLHNTFFPNLPSENDKKQLVSILENDKLIEWSQNVEFNLKHFAGQTHTVLGLYDWMAFPEYASKTGFDFFPKKADVYFDLGGGFATPDISRVIGNEFVSLDIISPKDAEQMKLNFHVLKKWGLPYMTNLEVRPQTDQEREQYFRSLSRTKWIDYDIFTDPLPDNHQSYLIASFGFLSSAIASLSEASISAIAVSDVEKFLKFHVTTYVGFRRIMDLVAAGKDVDVFTYQRVYGRLHRTVFLSFRNRQLRRIIVWPEKAEGLKGARLEYVERQD